MEDKYLSIITNFGCHYTCPYCIVKNNNLHIPKTTVEGLDNLVSEIEKNNCNWVSISGGGDPLFNHEQHKDWWKRFWNIIPNDVKTELHTSIIENFELCETVLSWQPEYWDRIVYHCQTFTQLYSIRKYNENTIVRVVFVVTKDFTPELIRKIADFVKNSTEIDELSFRQMVDDNYNTTHYYEEFLKAGHKKDWWYIEQNDYNLYYAENKVYNKYKNFKINHCSYKPTTKEVIELREMTGAGIVNCTNALRYTNGDKEEAIEFIKRNPWMFNTPMKDKWYTTYIKKNDVIEMIQNTIESLKEDIVNDANMYFSNTSKEIHDEKLQFAIEELLGINNEIKEMEGIKQ